MTEQRILEKLSTLEKQSDTMNKKVDKIEAAVSLIAVQSERINNTQKQIQALWVKYDESFGTDGTISRIKQFQASCPKKDVDKSINRLWWAIGVLSTLMAGCLIKTLNIAGGG